MSVAVSLILPVFNKADVLPHSVRAIERQTMAAACELVFVDDASTDGSLDCMRALAARLPNATVISNQRNAGPAIRLNQGAAAARGELLCLIDADVLLAPDAVERMAAILKAEGAQAAHGRTMPSAEPAESLMPPLLADQAFSISDAPLKTVLAGSFVRMGWMVETALFRAAGGCDERIFIQDESLPLRLAAAARRIAWTEAAIAYAPRAAFHLSSDRRQQHHDRFRAHYNLLGDRPDLPQDVRRQLVARCLSAGWKAVRSGGLGLPPAPVLGAYLLAEAGISGQAMLPRLAAAFAGMERIRRP